MAASRGLPTILLLTQLVLIGCDAQPRAQDLERPTIPEETFASALSDLVIARIEILPDTAAYRVRAAQILADHRMTEGDLRTYVEVHGRDEGRMTRAYARVEARLDSLYPSGQAVAPVDSLLDAAIDDPDSAP